MVKPVFRKYGRKVGLVLALALLLLVIPLVQFIVPALAEPVHDLAVLSVDTRCSASYTWCTNEKVYVAVENQGNITEDFNVTVWYKNETGPPGLITRGSIASRNVTLGPGENVNLTFTWTIKNWKVDKYTVCANVSVVPGETDVADNSLEGPVFTLKMGGDGNGDGFIGGFDSTIVGINWWTSVPPCHQADSNCDGFIDGFDATIIGIYWWSSVPKPE